MGSSYLPPPEQNVVNVGDELSQSAIDAINAASFPSGTNPFRTLSDGGGGGISAYDNFKTYQAGELVIEANKLFRFNSYIGAAGYGPITHPSAWTEISAVGDGYAPLAGATFTGPVVVDSELSGQRIVGVPTNGVAGINIGIGGDQTSSTTAGDVWIASGGTLLNYRDATGSWRQVLTTSQIGVIDTSATNPALRITQRGTGHSFVVEDTTTPDATALIVNNDGSLGVGVSNSSPTWTATRKFEVRGEALVTSSAVTNPALSIVQNGQAQALYIAGTGGSPAIRITSDLRMSIGCNDSEANTSLTLGRPLGGSALCIQSGWLQIGTVSQGATLKLIAGSTIQFTSGVGLEDVLTPQVNPNTSDSFTSNTYPDEVVVKIDGITYAIPARQI